MPTIPQLLREAARMKRAMRDPNSVKRKRNHATLEERRRAEESLKARCPYLFRDGGGKNV